MPHDLGRRRQVRPGDPQLAEPSCPAVEQLEVAGSYRRGNETIGDLDFLVVSSQPEAVMDHFAAFPDGRA